MDRVERLAVIVLFAGLLAWLVYGPRAERPAADEWLDPEAAGEVQPASEPARAVAPADPDAQESDPDAQEPAPVAVEPGADDRALVPTEPESFAVLENDRVRLELSSHGGGISELELRAYPRTVAELQPLVLPFSERHALQLSGVPGARGTIPFALSSDPAARTVTAVAQLPNGLVLERFVTLTDGYQLTVTDTFHNTGETVLGLTNLTVSTGAMQPMAGITATRGISYLDVDSYSPGDGVAIWGKEINRLFGAGGGCARPDLGRAPERAQVRHDIPASWIAAKNKFFTLILAPERPAAGIVVSGRRSLEEPDTFVMAAVSGSLIMPAVSLDPGERHAEHYSYYAGPKEFSRLRQLGGGQDKVMFRSWPGFGWWRWACIGLLYLLNWIYAVIPNYGVAIILLTVIVKLVFWPITHKGNLHMKRMQSLQPELKKLREKYKDKPKKLQQAQMEMYQQHGVNPLAGCLPMVVQIPVFIALFTVLRSAVELRFAGFLWVADLSEPEGLLAGVIPFPASGLNLLPLAMTATMVLQQRMTPSSGDPQQQKMLMFMPLMMLFIFYSMPSALVLYWTVSQSLSIVQLALQKRAGNTG